jgi:isopentenyl-diphosphate Delta-isomerase
VTCACRPEPDEGWMGPVTELLYRVTPEDEVLGSVDRDAAHGVGALHRSGIVFLGRSDGRILMQHRTPSKRIFPDRYDCSAAFHVAFGESYEQAAVRELREETGVSAPVRWVGKFTHHDPPEDQIVAVFTCESDAPIRVDPTESAGSEFLRKAEIDTIVRSKRVTPWLRDGWPLARGHL